MARKTKTTKTFAAPRPLTLEERHNSAAAKAGAAVSIFTAAADDLIDAANELYMVEGEAAEEIRRLESLREQARAEAAQRDDQALAIRTLLGSEAAQ